MFKDKFARSLGVLEYLGTWNASTNTPELTDGVGQKGGYYIVSTGGTTSLGGYTDWEAGDWAIFNGTAWQQVDNTDAVVSVNGLTGAITLATVASSGDYNDLVNLPGMQTIATSASASDLLGGTVANELLSADVVLKDASQTLTAKTYQNAEVYGDGSVASALSVTGLWDSGSTYTSLLVNMTATDYNANSNLMNLNLGGVSKFRVLNDGSVTTPNMYSTSNRLSLNSTAALGFASGSSATGTVDTILTRDAANTLVQRNSTTAQTFRLYATYTDGSNYVRLTQRAASDRFSIAVEAAGTGSARALEISAFSSASDPTSSTITAGRFGVWKNTTTGTVKLWYNDGGTMKSVTLS